ncbi:MAG TPA: hypothetical protein VFG89_06070 [Coriobacteriia bacterium]|nr:hypothetical protein [Coriobacteriia bacterium]
MLGDQELLAGLGACSAPLAQQVERLRQALDEHWTGGYTLQIAELEDLDDSERHAVIDAVVAGDESPYVVVDGQLVCTGGVDPSAVLATRG